MTPDTVVGHARVRGRLEVAVAEGTLSHATLLAGPEAVGKTTVAVEFLAPALIDRAGWPGALTSHPDLWLEDGPAERIGIGRVRGGGREGEGHTLQDFLALHGYSGGPRLAVMARAERLTVEAANCILRTVEEPPAGTHIVLCTSHPERLPATLLSRCQVHHLGPVDRGDIADWLHRRHAVDAARAGAAAALAGGRPGRALRLASEPEALEGELVALDRFLAAAGSGDEGALRAAAGLAPATGADGRERSLIQLAVWADFLRDAACRAAGASDLVHRDLHRDAVECWAALPPWRLAGMLQGCIGAADELERNAHPRLCYENLFLDIFARDPAPPVVAPDARRKISAGGR